MQAVFVRNGLMGQVRGEAIALFFFRAAEKLVHLFFGQSDRKNAVLEAIVVKNIGEARRNDHAKPIIQNGPRRMLAARTTAEIGGPAGWKLRGSGGDSAQIPDWAFLPAGSANRRTGSARNLRESAPSGTAWAPSGLYLR